MPEDLTPSIDRIIALLDEELSGLQAHSRTALFLSAMAAICFNPHIKPFYERLLTAGKHKKVALIACIRKIVTALNAMLRDNVPWNAATS